jgi:chromate transporter
MSEADESGTPPPPSAAELFVGFMRISAFAFGGVLPWARYVLVERERWLTPDEFVDMLALCQLLPGANIANMAIAIGGRFQGKVGAASALLGLLALPVTVAVGLVSLYAQFAQWPAVRGALAGMAAAAAGLIVAMAVKLAEPMLRKRPFATAPVIALTFCLVGILRLPLLPVILGIAPLAILIAWRAEGRGW